MTRGINLAIGPSCYTKCGGCYNHFAGSARRKSTVTADELLNFIDKAKSLDPQAVTIHGGDPLSHPEFVKIIRGIHQRGLEVKVDTVGTPLLENVDADVIFFGTGTTPNLSAEDVLPWIHRLGIPVDGSTNEIGQLFRAGRANQVGEAFRIIDLVQKHGGPALNINTTVHKGNLHDISAIAERALGAGVPKLQLFQFQPTGPIAHHNAAKYMITHEEFASVVDRVRVIGGSALNVDAKSARDRDGFYFLVDDEGVAYVPNGPGQIRIGHIERDADRVLAALEWHFDDSKSTTIGRALRGLGESGAAGIAQLLPIISPSSQAPQASQKG